jgi:hypothetical protein
VTCRRLAAILLACAAVPTASAQADLVLNPAGVFAVGSQPMQVAQGLARQHWGVDPCGGQVTISWTPLAPQINATSTWTNPRSSYDNPDLNGDCRIEFNTGMDFDWDKFCTVVVHEYGHLSGKPHSPDPHNVMAAFYDDALPECVAAEASVGQAPAPAPAADASKAGAQAARVTQPSAGRAAPAKATPKKHRKRVVKRGKHHRKQRGAKARAARAIVVRHAD